jgi:hypothetical protein
VVKPSVEFTLGMNVDIAKATLRTPRTPVHARASLRYVFWQIVEMPARRRTMSVENAMTRN